VLFRVFVFLTLLNVFTFCWTFYNTGHQLGQLLQDPVVVRFSCEVRHNF
jgi:hypothetical protein